MPKIVASRLVSVVAPLGLGALLVAGLFALSGLSLATLGDAILATDLGLFLLIVVSTSVHLIISAYKWSLVTKRLIPALAEGGSFVFYFFYTTLGAVTGQVLPVQLSTVAARTLGLRFHHGVQSLPGAGTSLLEQAFDLIAPLALAVPGLLYVFDQLSFAGAAGLAGLMLVALGAVTAVYGPRVGATAPRPASDAKGMRALLGRLGERLGVPQGCLDRPFLMQLYVLSVLRFANLVLRAILVVYAVGFALRPEDIAAAMPLVQLSFILSVTPAGIGLTEWTWSGVLAVLGVGFELATAYAVLLRLLVVAALVLCGVLALVMFAGTRPWRTGARPTPAADGPSTAV